MFIHKSATIHVLTHNSVTHDDKGSETALGDMLVNDTLETHGTSSAHTLNFHSIQGDVPTNTSTQHFKNSPFDDISKDASCSVQCGNDIHIIKVSYGSSNIFEIRNEKLETKQQLRKPTKPKVSAAYIIDYFRILNGNMLSDIDINVAQELIKKQFVNMPGLQNVLLGVTYEVVSREMIQIINNGAFHWLLLSTVGCENGHINMFDSMATRSELPMHVQMQIASLLACPFKQVHFHYQACQQQTGGVDCGLFAIAFAIDICLGSKVDSMTYKQSSMRQHLFQCLQSGKFTSFP